MKYTDVQDLIVAHYKSEDDFHNVVNRIIENEDKAGKEIAANRIRATFNSHAGKKREGYTVKPLQELTTLNKSKANMCERRQSDITLKNAIAPEATINQISEAIREFKARNALQKYGLDVTNKILLSGPPGVGKTWTALAIAGELNMELVFVRWDSLISSYLGDTGNNVRKIFEVAKNEPVVLFLDEFDAVGKERGRDRQDVGEMSRIVINILQNIDMFSPDSFLIAATNHGHLLDSAIWRRFSVVNMELPGNEERRKLIGYYSKDLPIEIDAYGMDGDKWVKDTHGMSGADIKGMLHHEAKQYILNSMGGDLGCATAGR